jgi:hypothetical protein
MSIFGKEFGHRGARKPWKDFAGSGGGPARIFSIHARFGMGTDDPNRPSSIGAVKAMFAFTPIASPVLRISGPMIEPSYCTHSNQPEVHTGG